MAFHAWLASSSLNLAATRTLRTRPTSSKVDRIPCKKLCPVSYTSILLRFEHPQTEMASESQCQRSLDLDREPNFPKAALAIRLRKSWLAAKPIKVDGPALAAMHCYIRKRLHLRLGQAALAAFAPDLIRHIEAPLSVPRVQIGRHRLPDARWAEIPMVRERLGLAVSFEHYPPFLVVAGPEALESADGAQAVVIESRARVNDDVIDASVAVRIFRQIEGMAVTVAGRQIVPGQHAWHLPAGDLIRLLDHRFAHDLADAHRILDARQRLAH